MRSICDPKTERSDKLAKSSSPKHCRKSPLCKMISLQTLVCVKSRESWSSAKPSTLIRYCILLCFYYSVPGVKLCHVIYNWTVEGKHNGGGHQNTCQTLSQTGDNFELNEFRQIPNWILDELVQPWPSWLWKSSDCDGMGWGEVLPELKLGIQRLELGIPCSRWLLFKLLDNCPNLFSGCSDVTILSPKKTD